ncbi:MAG TPA: hypothetical protein VG297_26175, partial [Bryobacteraceae bacterium]|nr:hypothetical protein [Bryobacteraceae bacterium]
EHQFALSIAEDHWRINRARTLEQNIFAITATFHNSAGDMETEDTPRGCLVRDQEAEDLDTALAYVRTYIADPGRLNLLSLYERRIHGNVSRSLKQLQDLQAVRLAAEASARQQAEAARARALEEECLLAQLAEAEGIPYDPADSRAPNGLVFSSDEIAAASRRKARLEAARRLSQPRRVNRTPPFDNGHAPAYTT